MSDHNNVRGVDSLLPETETSLRPFPELGTGYGSHYLTTSDDGLVLLDTKSIPTRGQWSVVRIGGPAWYRRWLVNRWNVLNELLFDSRMKEPTDLVIGSRTTVLGTWSPWKRQLLVSAVCFSHKTEEHALGTLAHEMAHQYESEHSPRPYGEDAHGQMWKKHYAEHRILGSLKILRTVSGTDQEPQSGSVRDPGNRVRSRRRSQVVQIWFLTFHGPVTAHCSS